MFWFWVVGHSLSLTNDGLCVMARYVVKSDSILVKIVENCKTKFITLPVVRLGPLFPVKWSRYYLLFSTLTDAHPPVLDQLTSLYLFLEGQLMFLPLTFPPVQKYLCLSLARRPRNSLSLAELSRLIACIPLARQKASPSLWVNLEQPTLQLTRKSFPWYLWLGW